MFENDYYTERNYENKNIFDMNKPNNADLNLKYNTQNYFNNNNLNDINENEQDLNHPNNNINNNNFIHKNSNSNQYNNDVGFFQKRINKLQNKVGKLNNYRKEINEAISYKLDSNNNNKYDENQNRTQDYFEKYDNNYINEKEKKLKMSESFDVFKMNFNNYDFVFDSGDTQNYEEENYNNIDNNYIWSEEEQLNNENINANIVNLENNNLDLMFNGQKDEHSFIGVYDNIFSSKNMEQEDEEKNNNEENNIPENINNNNENDNNKKYDYKNIKLYEQNYQFNIPKTIENNLINEEPKNGNKNTIQIVSNELSILTNENKGNPQNINKSKDINDNNQIINEEKKNNENLDEENKKVKNQDENRKKELQNYDKIIAQAKKLNNQFILEQKEPDDKGVLSSDNKEPIVNKKEENLKSINKEPENIGINKEENNIIIAEKKDIKKDNKEKKVDNKHKNVFFIEDKIYIKYQQEDYILKTNVINSKKEKINFVTHDLKKYIQRLKKKEYLEPALINSPEIDYNKINNEVINTLKKEKIVQNQNPRINNRGNKSVKIPSNNKAQINKKNEIKTIKKIDKNGTKFNSNNIKPIKNKNNINKETNIKTIPNKNLNKVKIMQKNKADKLLKKNNEDKKDKEKYDIKNLDIFDNPIFKEGQKAFNNLKKFFEENDLDEDYKEE